MNVIGEGYNDAGTLIAYMISDYEFDTPKVYRDSKEHNFHNTGMGFKSGDRLFYGVAGVDAAAEPGGLMWFWGEIPAAYGNPVAILDATGRQPVSGALFMSAESLFWGFEGWSLFEGIPAGIGRR